MQYLIYNICNILYIIYAISYINKYKILIIEHSRQVNLIFFIFYLEDFSPLCVPSSLSLICLWRTKLIISCFRPFHFLLTFFSWRTKLIVSLFQTVPFLAYFLFSADETDSFLVSDRSISCLLSFLGGRN